MDAGEARVLREQVFQALTAYATSIHSNVISIFRSRDRDQSGGLSARELAQLLTDLLPNASSPKQVMAVMSEFDKNKNGVIEYEEMLHTIQEWQRKKRQCGSGTRSTCDPALVARIYSKAPGSVYWARTKDMARSTLGPWRAAEAAHNRPVPRIQFKQSTRPRSQAGGGLIARFSDRSKQSSHNRHRGSSAHLPLGGTRSSVGTRSSAGSRGSAWWDHNVDAGKHNAGRSQLLSRSASAHSRRTASTSVSRKHKDAVRWEKFSGGYEKAPRIAGEETRSKFPCDGRFG